MIEEDDDEVAGQWFYGVVLAIFIYLILRRNTEGVCLMLWLLVLTGLLKAWIMEM